MIYTEKTCRAIKFMFEKHKNQVDKAGVPYVFHPWHVAEQMPDEESTIVALLHDVVEDTDAVIEDIEELGYGTGIITAVQCLTHDGADSYMDYIRRVALNATARRVKLADLTHNSDLSRFLQTDDEIVERYERYKKCKAFLEMVENRYPGRDISEKELSEMEDIK